MVNVGAGDAPPGGDPLGSLELVGHVQVEVLGAGTAVDEIGVGQVGGVAVAGNVGAQPHLGHVLHAARHPGIDRTGGDEVGHHVVGLLGGPALGVNGGGRHLIGEMLTEPRRAGHIRCLLAGLGHTATHHLTDRRRVDSGTFNHAPLDLAEQVGGMGVRPHAVATTNGGANRLDNDWGSHGQTSTTVRMTRPARMSSSALLMSSRPTRWLIMPSRSSRPLRHSRMSRAKSRRTSAEP